VAENLKGIALIYRGISAIINDVTFAKVFGFIFFGCSFILYYLIPVSFSDIGIKSLQIGITGLGTLLGKLLDTKMQSRIKNAKRIAR
jgi:hypothetical protein